MYKDSIGNSSKGSSNNYLGNSFRDFCKKSKNFIGWFFYRKFSKISSINFSRDFTKDFPRSFFRNIQKFLKIFSGGSIKKIPQISSDIPLKIYSRLPPEISTEIMLVMSSEILSRIFFSEIHARIPSEISSRKSFESLYRVSYSIFVFQQGRPSKLPTEILSEILPRVSPRIPW